MKGEGEGEGGIWARARVCGARDALSPSRAPHALSRAQIPPSPSPFNAGHAGYLIARRVRTWVVLEKRNITIQPVLQNKLQVS